jgi:hypothetical protein
MILLNFQYENIVDQKSKINTFKVNWQGEEEQIDDNLIVGSEFSDLIEEK